MRTIDERVRDVRRWLDVAARLHADRARWIPALVESTGLSESGVELGFASLEREASDAELRQLVERAGDAASVHVVLSANVFVAALRAIALARAAAPRVTVRPSSRDPVLARALLEEARDPAVTLAPEREVSAIDAAVVHVYGRDETIAEVRARVRPGTRVLGHGAGLGVAVITASADLAGASTSLARDIAAFDQRGCLSPRVVVALGSPERATELVAALHASLSDLGRSVPRGRLFPEEVAEAARWRDLVAFAGTLAAGDQHAVALGEVSAAVALPPPGRNVLVLPAVDLEVARARIAPLARFVVTVGSDDPALAASLLPGARPAHLGLMQRPPLDGPVDLREASVPQALTSR